MKRHRALSLRLAFVAGWILLCLGTTQAATFNYHGTLSDAGKPAEGNYDLELTIYSASSGGSPVAGPLRMYKVPVNAGSFSVEADFGPLARVSGATWLEVKVRAPGTDEFSMLSARAPVSADVADSVCPGAWTTSGNAGTVPGTGGGQNYLGTADNQALVIAVKGAQAARIAPSTDVVNHPDSVNVVLGSPGNFVGSGIGGATVGGGGSAAFANCGPSANQLCVNSATGPFSTVAGGYYNVTAGDTAAIGGGALNAASGIYSTVAGGIGGIASASWSSVCGGSGNIATANWASVQGGLTNSSTGALGFVGGGYLNTASGYSAVAAGGYQNNSAGFYGVIAGGYANLVDASTNYATVSGGNNNVANATDATVSGGNTNTASGGGAVVGGGTNDIASGGGAVVAGGDANTASGALAAIAGGNLNTAIGANSFVAGGGNNQAGGDFSFAAGSHAHVRSAAEVGNTSGDQGSFVWADQSSASAFATTGPNQFLIRAIGGVAINGLPNDPNAELTIRPRSGDSFGNSDLFMYTTSSNKAIGITVTPPVTPATGQANLRISQLDGLGGSTVRLSINDDGSFQVYGTAIKPGGGSWTAPSDRRIKQDIAAIADPIETLLKLHPVSFHYTPQYRAMSGDMADRPFLGFIAQEYAEVFPQAVMSTNQQVPGADAGEPNIMVLDPDPALITTVAAVQELAMQMRAGDSDKDAQIATLQHDNQVLRQRMDEMAARLERLEAKPER